jgi:hypothetical protein
MLLTWFIAEKFFDVLPFWIAFFPGSALLFAGVFLIIFGPPLLLTS